MSLGLYRDLIKITDSLKFDEAPDYNYYVSRLIESIGGKSRLDWVMDWSKTTFMWHALMSSRSNKQRMEHLNQVKNSEYSSKRS